MNTQMKVEKILCYVVLGIFALGFVFSLGLLTDIYQLYLISGDTFDLIIMQVLIDDPASTIDITATYTEDLWTEMQPFNATFVGLSVISLVSTVSLFITQTHKRHRYYITNYIASALVAIIGIAFALYLIPEIAFYKNKFLTESPFEIWSYAPKYFSKIRYTESTFWLDINTLIQVLIIVSSMLLVLNSIWKTLLVKEEKRLLGEPNIDNIDVNISDENSSTLDDEETEEIDVNNEDKT